MSYPFPDGTVLQLLDDETNKFLAAGFPGDPSTEFMIEVDPPVSQQDLKITELRLLQSGVAPYFFIRTSSCQFLAVVTEDTNPNVHRITWSQTDPRKLDEADQLPYLFALTKVPNGNPNDPLYFLYSFIASEGNLHRDGDILLMQISGNTEATEIQLRAYERPCVDDAGSDSDSDCGKPIKCKKSDNDCEDPCKKKRRGKRRKGCGLAWWAWLLIILLILLFIVLVIYIIRSLWLKFQKAPTPVIMQDLPPVKRYIQPVRREVQYEVLPPIGPESQTVTVQTPAPALIVNQESPAPQVTINPAPGTVQRIQFPPTVHRVIASDAPDILKVERPADQGTVAQSTTLSGQTTAQPLVVSQAPGMMVAAPPGTVPAGALPAGTPVSVERQGGVPAAGNRNGNGTFYVHQQPAMVKLSTPPANVVMSNAGGAKKQGGFSCVPGIHEPLTFNRPQPVQQQNYSASYGGVQYHPQPYPQQQPVPWRRTLPPPQGRSAPLNMQGGMMSFLPRGGTPPPTPAYAGKPYQW